MLQNYLYNSPKRFYNSDLKPGGIMRYFFLPFILVLFFIPPLLAEINYIQGTVYHDQNRNLQLDPGEKGIPGVLVSNQLDIVKTDKNGRYKLAIQDRSIIFVIKPAEYDLPVNARNLPQFYYLHYPQGSPPLKYRGVDPTGPLPAAVNFPLFSSPISDSFRVMVFSDPQPHSTKDIEYIRDDIVAEVCGTTASFGITLGDIVYDDLSLFDYYLDVTSQIGIPFYHVPGNHDENYDVPNDELAMETFKRYFGPNYYAFQYGKVHFIVLDDIEYKGQKNGKFGGYQGKIGEKQLQWVANYLPYVPDDHLLVFAMHIPFYASEGDEASIRVVDRDKLFSLIQSRSHVLALAGHMHIIENYFLKPEQGWTGGAPFLQVTCAAVSGTWWKGPLDVRGIPIADQMDGAGNGYHIFSFHGNTFSQVYKAAFHPADFQIRISQPTGKVYQKDLASLSILANVFNSNEKSLVECQLDENPAVQMTLRFALDPYIEAIHEMNSQLYNSWIKPQKTTHLWTAPLPTNLSPGIHKIRVTAKNQWGDIYHSVRIFEVE